MKRIVLLLIIITTVTIGSAQLKIGSPGASFMPTNWTPNAWDWNPNNYSLLNPNNYSMNHSMSFSTAYRTGGASLYQSRYTNHISYQVNEKMDINVDLHVTNFGTANVSKGFNIKSNEDNATNIVPDFSINYRPTENTTINFIYRGASNNPNFRRNYHWRD